MHQFNFQQNQSMRAKSFDDLTIFQPIFQWPFHSMDLRVAWPNCANFGKILGHCSQQRLIILFHISDFRNKGNWSIKETKCRNFYLWKLENGRAKC